MSDTGLKMERLGGPGRVWAEKGGGKKVTRAVLGTEGNVLCHL